MIVHMDPEIQEGDPRIDAVADLAKLSGLIAEVHVEPGTTSKPIEIYLKDGEKVRASSVPEYSFENLPGVAQVVRVSLSRVSALKNGDSGGHVIRIGSDLIGPEHPCLLVAGQCADDIYTPQTIRALAQQGVKHVRTGFRKPRSSPDGFRGFGTMALERTFTAARDNGIESVWLEVIESSDIEEVLSWCAKCNYTGLVVLWVGARNLGNYRLLEALGKQKTCPVMLKHGLRMRSIDELLDRASFVLAGPMFWKEDGSLDEERSLLAGNNRLLFCVRGLEKVDRHDPHRFAPNFGWLDALASRSWANRVLDVSHMAGSVPLVFDCLGQGLPHNPDVVLLESHIKPTEALCDPSQAIPVDRISEIIQIVDAHNEQSTR